MADTKGKKNNVRQPSQVEQMEYLAMGDAATLLLVETLRGSLVAIATRATRLIDDVLAP